MLCAADRVDAQVNLVIVLLVASQCGRAFYESVSRGLLSHNPPVNPGRLATTMLEEG